MSLVVSSTPDWTVVTYRQLQAMAKYFGFPSNLKKETLINILDAKMKGHLDEVDDLIWQVKLTRMQNKVLRKQKEEYQKSLLPITLHPHNDRVTRKTRSRAQNMSLPPCKKEDIDHESAPNFTIRRTQTRTRAQYRNYMVPGESMCYPPQSLSRALPPPSPSPGTSHSYSYFQANPTTSFSQPLIPSETLGPTSSGMMQSNHSQAAASVPVLYLPMLQSVQTPTTDTVLTSLPNRINQIFRSHASAFATNSPNSHSRFEPDRNFPYNGSSLPGSIPLFLMQPGLGLETITSWREPSALECLADTAMTISQKDTEDQQERCFSLNRQPDEWKPSGNRCNAIMRNSGSVEKTPQDIPTWNNFLEQKSSSYEVTMQLLSCKYGCRQKFTDRTDQQKHEDHCHLQLLDCPMPNCTWYNLLRGLESHIYNCHRNNIANSSEMTFVIEFEKEPNKFYYDEDAAPKQTCFLQLDNYRLFLISVLVNFQRKEFCICIQHLNDNHEWISSAALEVSHPDGALHQWTGLVELLSPTANPQDCLIFNFSFDQLNYGPFLLHSSLRVHKIEDVVK